MGAKLADIRTLYDAAGGLQNGDFTAVELAKKMLARIEEKDGRVKAYLSVDAERALAQAAASDRRRRDGTALGRFDGVPVAVKDNLSVTGQPCGCASKILTGYTAGYDATVIARLRAAGMIFLGRTNMDEFAMGSSTENSGVQVTCNPWRLDCVPGGSSGGSAAAVAAEAALAALGSDTGGSIRQPASFCGVVGLKPTYGRVSRYGLVAFASSLDQIGPMTHDVRDAAIMMDLIQGHDPRDCTSLPDTPGAEKYEAGIQNSDVRGLRIGLPREYLAVEGLDPEVKDAIERVAKQLTDQGAELVDISLPNTEYAVATYYIIATAEASANLARFDGIRYGYRSREGEAENLLETYRQSRAEGFGTEVKRRIILGTYVLSSGYYDAYYLRAQKVRTLIRQDFLEAFSQCDLILAPTAPTPAFKRGAISSPLQMYLSDIYTLSANLAGIPGISVPYSVSKTGGLPIGVQFMGPFLGEAELLRVASVVEKLAPSTGRRAPL